MISFSRIVFRQRAALRRAVATLRLTSLPKLSLRQKHVFYTEKYMGRFRRVRPPTRAIPNIRLLDDHLKQIKEFKNRIWRTISRALGAKNIRSMARRVNSLFSKRVHGWRRVQQQLDAETVAPVPERTPDVSTESVADPLADLGPELPPYINLDKLAHAVLAGTGMFAHFSEHDKHEEAKWKTLMIMLLLISGILTSVDSDEHMQPPLSVETPSAVWSVAFKHRNSKCCLVSSLTVIEYLRD